MKRVVSVMLTLALIVSMLVVCGNSDKEYAAGNSKATST